MGITTAEYEPCTQDGAHLWGRGQAVAAPEQARSVRVQLHGEHNQVLLPPRATPPLPVPRLLGVPRHAQALQLHELRLLQRLPAVWER